MDYKSDLKRCCVPASFGLFHLELTPDMISIETPVYGDEAVDPSLLAYRRRAIDWDRDGSVEIPISLTAGWRGFVGYYRWGHQWASRPVVEYGGFVGYLDWRHKPFPPFRTALPLSHSVVDFQITHVAVDLQFRHRAVKDKVLTYDGVEGQPHQTSFYSSITSFLAILHRDSEGIMPRILIKRLQDAEFQVEFRYRTDFADVFASVLGQFFFLSAFFLPDFIMHREGRRIRYTPI